MAQEEWVKVAWQRSVAGLGVLGLRVPSVWDSLGLYDLNCLVIFLTGGEMRDSENGRC